MGDIDSSMQGSLVYLVTDEKLNNASVRCLLDPKFLKSIMQNPDPLVLVFRDIPKFNTQNLIVGTLLKQIQSSKLTEQNLSEVLGKLPSVKDIEIKSKLVALKNLNKESNMMMMIMMMIIITLIIIMIIIIIIGIYHHHLYHIFQIQLPYSILTMRIVINLLII